MKNRGAISVTLLVVLGIIVVLVIMLVAAYNGLIKLNEGAKQEWSNVKSQYQRRFDLIPNLVNTVKGAAKFEKETYTAVTEARAKVGQVNIKPEIDQQTMAQITKTQESLKTVDAAHADVDKTNLTDPQAMAKFQQAFTSFNSDMASSLSRLLVVVEKYPDLKATQNFRDLQVQLEGTENRINVARTRYNESARKFNTRRNSFPTVMLAGFFGGKFNEKAYFESQAGAETAPKVNFD